MEITSIGEAQDIIRFHLKEQCGCPDRMWGDKHITASEEYRAAKQFLLEQLAKRE